MASQKAHSDPNELLLPETAAQFEVVNWKFGPLIHYPRLAHLGQLRGRVCLKDLKPDYAARLVDAGFPYLRRREVAAAPTEQAEPPAEDTATDKPARKKGKK